MSIVKDDLAAYKKAHNIGNNAPPDREIIQSIDLKEDVTTKVDVDGKELCRLYIEIDGRKIFFKFPVFDKYENYIKKFAELAIYLSKCIGEVEMTPSNIELFKNPVAKTLWAEATGYAVSGSRRVRQLILDIFFNTLGAYVDGIECEKRFWESKKLYEKRVTKKHLQWFKANATMDKLQHVLYCCFAVDELIKKKATLGNVIKSPHLLSQAQSSKNTSAQLQESTPKSSVVTQFSSLKPL